MGIYRRGQVYWASWVRDQKRYRKSLGTSDRREAEALYDQLTTGSGPTLIFREILKLWLGHQTPRCKPHSIRVYKTACKRFTMSFGDRRPEEITPLLVEQFQDNLLMVGLGPRTINYQVGIALSAIRWAHDRELIEHGPPKWKPLKIRDKHSRKYLTASEIQKLLTTVRDPQWKSLESIIMLALYTGLRQQEIAWLTWEDVDLVEGWIHVRPKRGWSPKSRSSERSIPIAAGLAAYFNATPPVCARWVAPLHPGQKWSSRYLCTKTRQLFKAAGVDDGSHHTLHRLRGTFATTVLRGGGDLESLREVLGHQQLSGKSWATSNSP